MKEKTFAKGDTIFIVEYADENAVKITKGKITDVGELMSGSGKEVVGLAYHVGGALGTHEDYVTDNVNDLMPIIEDWFKFLEERNSKK